MRFLAVCLAVSTLALAAITIVTLHRSNDLPPPDNDKGPPIRPLPFPGPKRGAAYPLCFSLN